EVVVQLIALAYAEFNDVEQAFLAVLGRLEGYYAIAIVTTAAPDELITSAVAIQVLRWLTQSPQIPAASKQEYLASLIIWEARFQQRARIHMRKIAKTQELWESGELA
ncbi:hypothetical protein LCGC14_1936270, partial [marine sediment metagenome]